MPQAARSRSATSRSTLEARDGELTIVQADGDRRLDRPEPPGQGTLDPDDPARSPVRVHAEATNLELDGRLRRWLPDEAQEIWDAYFPEVNARRRHQRRAGQRRGEPGPGRRPGPRSTSTVDVDCLDVSMKYKHFAYPVDHVQGKIHAHPRRR